MHSTTNHLLGAVVAVCCLFGPSAQGQSSNEQEENQQLTAKILHLDSLFWKTYNECDVNENARYYTSDIMFYHDKGGVSIGGEVLKNSLKNNVCGHPNQKIRREAVAGTVHVFPMRNGTELYGAVLSGEHYFYVSQDGRPEIREGQANFTHLWLLKDQQWRMSYVLSYNHHQAPFATSRKEIALPAATLKQYEGTYKNEKSGSFTIRANGGQLTMEGPGFQASLFAETPTFFFSKERDLQFEFATASRHKVSKIIVHEKGKMVEELEKE